MFSIELFALDNRYDCVTICYVKNYYANFSAFIIYRRMEYLYGLVDQ